MDGPLGHFWDFAKERKTVANLNEDIFCHTNTPAASRGQNSVMLLGKKFLEVSSVYLKTFWNGVVLPDKKYSRTNDIGGNWKH